ncbi:uncharacterized protein LOC142573952 isoform X3 [Dermacentor variabilis]|uniref:uncharacterized protein LOC142573952 isoform X3 n=1 Tax=Dermacentor variabilis TaxID=34621 RepID=UPI003F5AE3F1
MPTSVADSRSIRVASPTKGRGFDIGRPVSVSCTNSPSSPRLARPLTSVSAGDKGSLTDVGNIQPAEDKDTIRRKKKPGPRGFLMWFVLSTPTALLSTVCSCLLLYLQHLRSSDVMQSAEDHRSIRTAAGKKLRKLGPVRDNLVVFGGSFLMMTSAMPWSASDYWNPQHRIVCWSGVARDLPWPVVIVQSAVQLIARIVEVCSS